MQVGDLIVYIPTHADGDIFHKACEVGVVTSLTDKRIFAKYYKFGIILNTTAHGCLLHEVKPFPFKVGDICTAQDNLEKLGIVTDIIGENVYIPTQYGESKSVHSNPYSYRSLRVSRYTKIDKILGDDK
jgi:hypothetical protein